MATNSYVTSQLVADEAVAVFQVNNSFISTAYRKYESMFSNTTYAPGDTINVRLDNFFIGSRGDSVQAEAIVEDKRPLTIKPLFSIPILYTPTDLQRKIVDFSAEFIQPAVRRLVTMMNEEIVNDALTQVGYWTGSPTANLNSFASIDSINPIMSNLGMDKAYKRYISLSANQLQQLRSASSLQNSFVEPLNKEITMNAQLTRLANFDLYEDQSITSFTAGTAAGTITVNAATGSGNTIALAGVTSGTTFVAGDVIRIAGVFEFNQIYRKSTGRVMQFVVQQNVTSTGGVTTIVVLPFLFEGPRANVIALGSVIASGALVTTVTDHQPNFAYTERGLIACMPPLEPMDCPNSSVTTDKKYGVSIRVSKTAEVLDNKNVMRVDCQMANLWIPQQSVRVVAALNQF